MLSMSTFSISGCLAARLHAQHTLTSDYIERVLYLCRVTALARQLQSVTCHHSKHNLCVLRNPCKT
jgi:hypothetical protein